MRLADERKTTENAAVLWKIRRKDELRCGMCKPHRVENATRQPRPDQYKEKRR